MYRNILFPIDVTEKASWDHALPVLKEFCEKFSPKVTLMTAVPDFGMSIVSNYFPENAQEKLVADARQALEGFAAEKLPGVAVETIVAQGPVYQCIIDSSEKTDADLIIMSAHRPELKDYLLGPNAAKVVRHSNRSVLVVRNRD